MNYVGLNSPCNFCKHPKSASYFITSMSKLLGEFIGFNVNFKTKRIVTIRDSHRLKCKHNLACSMLCQANSDIQFIDERFTVLVSHYFNSQDRYNLERLLSMSNPFYPRTVLEVRKLLSKTS